MLRSTARVARCTAAGEHACMRNSRSKSYLKEVRNARDGLKLHQRGPILRIRAMRRDGALTKSSRSCQSLQAVHARLRSVVQKY